MMENLGNYNLFTSHFIMGCISNINNKLESKEELNNWLKLKDSDYEMNKYSVNQTQYVAFLHEIDLNVFNANLIDLVNIYKKSFPYSEKEDFIKHIFDYSLYDLQNFINREYTFLGSPNNNNNYDFYCFLDASSKEYLEFALPSGKTIEHFKQYFKKIIQIINDVNFSNNFKEQKELKSKQAEIEPVRVPELSINQIALKYVYEGQQITRENSIKIVTEYGHNSGDALYNKYTHYSSPANRKGAPHPLTPRKLLNKINLLESIIEFVSNEKQNKIKEEVLTLKKIHKDEFQ